MCGIVGVAGFSLDREDKNAFSELLVCASLRGMDSTGIAAVKSTYEKGQQVGDWDVLKQIGPPTELFQYRDYDTLINSYAPKAYIGHCRKATMGAKSRKNAHPFGFDNVVGVHNGSIYGHQRDRNKFETDSEALYNNINELGVRAAIEPLANTGTAYALVWFDSRDNTLNFLRNQERPLYFCSLKERNVLYWASEPGMLGWILNRADNREHHEIKAVPVDTHFALKLFSGPEWMKNVDKEVIKPTSKVEVKSGAPFHWGEDEQKEWAEASETELAQAIKVAQAKADKEDKQKRLSLKKEESIARIMMRRRQNFPDTADVKSLVTPGHSETQTVLLPPPDHQQTSSPQPGSNGTVNSDGEIKVVKWFLGEEVTIKEYKNLLDLGCFGCGAKSKYGSSHMHISPVAYLCDDCCTHDREEVNTWKELANDPKYSKIERVYVQ